MAICEPGTVLACAIGPCLNPAEVTVHMAGYGPYPPLIFSVCQVCFDTFGSTLAQWPKVPLLYQPTKEISREELERSLTSHKDMIMLSPKSTITQAQIAEASATCDKVTQLCANILKKEGYEGVTWHPHTYENGEVRTIAERDGKPLPERTPTRSPYVTTGHVPIGETICRDIGIPEIEEEEFSPSLINNTVDFTHDIVVALDGKELSRTLSSKEDKQLRYPDYLSAAIDRVNDELLDRLEEDIRRIEAHPVSNPEQASQPDHKPGWLPGDD